MTEARSIPGSGESGTRQADATIYRMVEAVLCEGSVLVKWGDSHQSKFHPIWLRHQCECAHCGTPLNAVRDIRLHHIPEDIQPEEIELVSDLLRIQWSDGHASEYAARWLRDNCYTEAERKRRKHRPVLWDANIANALPEADFREVSRNPVARLGMLRTICDTGFCLVRNIPTVEAASRQLIELVGPQRKSHYGTYPLSSKNAVDNVGDTTGPLDPHTDETYRLSAIGITVFQVLRPASSGGESTLMDGFEAVARLRQLCPEGFDLLASVRVTTRRRDLARNSGGQQRFYSARMPLIRIDEDGDVVGVRLNERQIGPLDLPEAQIGPFYRALRRLFELVYNPALRITLPLETGEGLLFNNQRLLHGRTEYQPEDPGRSVLTSSVDLEEFYSSLRLLELAVEGRVAPVNYAQGMVG
jgi:hypothetical protein